MAGGPPAAPRVVEKAVVAVPATTAIAPALEIVIALTMWVLVAEPRVQLMSVVAATVSSPVVALAPVAAAM